MVRSSTHSTYQSNEAERKSQIRVLKKTLKIVNAGAEAKQDIASFFTNIWARKPGISYVNALQEIVELHWRIYTNTVETTRWFDLSKFAKTSEPSEGRGNKQNNHLTKDHDYGWLPLSAPSLKWTDLGRVGNLCNTCNMPHLPKPCRFADKKYAKLANHESNKSWKESAIEKAWATEFSCHQIEFSLLC